MPNDLTRSLAQVLISKYGGNVDHNIYSILLEIIDNSIDASSKTITINTIEKKDVKYLTICDDGNGVNNLNNLLIASHGKKDKIGCKNQGFLDYLMFLSDMKGTHRIFTNCNGIVSGMKIKLDKLYKEYQKQSSSDIRNINFDKCQSILMDDITFTDDEDSREKLQNNSQMLTLLENNGTYIEIQIGKEDINLDLVDINYFQYMYTNYSFELNFIGNKISINTLDNLCITKKYKPAYFYLDKKRHTNGNEIFKFYNSFNKECLYYKKTKIINLIDLNTYTDLEKSYKNKKKIVQTTLTLISEEDSKIQQKEFNTDIGALRKFWIETNGKLLGLPSFPKKTRGIDARNLKNIRLVFKINDFDLIKNVTMSNKSKTNINNIDNIIIRYIDYLKPYLSNFTYKNNEINDDNGILNMEKYFKDKNLVSVKISTPNQISTKLIPFEPIRSNPIRNVQSKPRQHKSKSPEPKLSKSSENIYSWPITCYFGIFDCKEEGISLNDNEYINCKFGFTKVDPKNRDSNYGPSWRKLNTIFVDEKGCRKSEGKILIEWEIKSALESIEVDIKWKDTGYEYFSCKLKDFGKVNNKIREVMNIYQNNNIFQYKDNKNIYV